MNLRAATRLACAPVLAAVAACGGSSTSPSQAPLPVTAESPSFRYHYATGDSVDANWQETYHAWATTKLGVHLPQIKQRFAMAVGVSFDTAGTEWTTMLKDR